MPHPRRRETPTALPSECGTDCPLVASQTLPLAKQFPPQLSHIHPRISPKNVPSMPSHRAGDYRCGSTRFNRPPRRPMDSVDIVKLPIIHKRKSGYSSSSSSLPFCCSSLSPSGERQGSRASRSNAVFGCVGVCVDRPAVDFFRPFFFKKI